MQLVNEKTGESIHVGDTVKTFRGETVIVIAFREPHKASSNGHVTIKPFGKPASYGREVYASVIGGKFVS